MMSVQKNVQFSVACKPQVMAGGQGGPVWIFGWGCAAETLEPLAYSRANSAEFCYPILD